MVGEVHPLLSIVASVFLVLLIILYPVICAQDNASLQTRGEYVNMAQRRIEKESELIRQIESEESKADYEQKQDIRYARHQAETRVRTYWRAFEQEQE